MRQSMAQETSKDVTPTPVRRSNPFTFFTEVRREASKVTWPSWKETYLTTIMVFIVTALAMAFFAVTDYFLGIGLNLLLGLGA